LSAARRPVYRLRIVHVPCGELTMLRTTWRYVLPALTMLAAGQAAAQMSPADIVKKIYDQAAVFCNGEDVAPPYTDKFMREVTKEFTKGKSALFVLYEGNWAGSIGMIEQAVAAEKALLIRDTMPAKTAVALKALVDPAVEELGGHEVVNDYEVEVPEEAPAAATGFGTRSVGQSSTP